MGPLFLNDNCLILATYHVDSKRLLWSINCASDNVQSPLYFLARSQVVY